MVWLVFICLALMLVEILRNSDVDLRVDKGTLKGMFALCGLYTEIKEALQMNLNKLIQAFHGIKLRHYAM